MKKITLLFAALLVFNITYAQDDATVGSGRTQRPFPQPTSTGEDRQSMDAVVGIPAGTIDGNKVGHP